MNARAKARAKNSSRKTRLASEKSLSSKNSRDNCPSHVETRSVGTLAVLNLGFSFARMRNEIFEENKGDQTRVELKKNPKMAAYTKTTC
jgi:hypothetical protein